MPRCGNCSALLAADNQAVHCGPCARRAVLGGGAPEKPDAFWRSPSLREAFRARHFGHVVLSYRLAHRPALSQATVGRWLDLTQSAVSRLERSPERVTDLRKLELWARALRVPEPHLWFRLSPLLEPVPPQDPAAPWDELLLRLARTEVGAATIEQLQVLTEELCCEYAWRDAGELLAEARRGLRGITSLLAGPCSLREHRELLVLAGWLALLVGCVEYDRGDPRRAEAGRRAALRIGREAGHGEIVAWAFEMAAWFALTRGRWAAVGEACAAGTAAAPHSSVAVQLSAQAAKAAARMGRREEVVRTLDEGHRLLGAHERPARPENHFVVDPGKWDFYAMDCFRVVGEDRRAAEHARELLRPDKAERAPMRAAEARLTLAVAAVRRGDLGEAERWTAAGLAAGRRSRESLRLVAGEVVREASRLFPGDPAARAVVGLVTDAFA
ncbi:hypothetical protein [Actinokineospora pegani]|uniref:hypothetical protein n=1 Tax=Actinokineospora pegani TaxID=2654637 RepID=UPI001F1A8768|nr:hypothetical protein [Actinokineospora pegani]